MKKAEVLLSLIKERRSRFPREYGGNPIDKEVLAEILESAQFAPNHKRTRPWRFEVLEGDKKDQMGERLAEIYKEITPPQSFLEKKYLDIPQKWKASSAVITIVVNFSSIVPEWEEIAAVSMGVQNMYLMTTAHGLGGYWSSPGLKDHLVNELNLQENQKCLGFFFIGDVL